ncbi:MAG TPA: hypothetical protein VOA87_18770 [Thermoanaerobaculia bacterium]|nr:hypothetical protein [Thermoanaerobaculia bacterium]
MTAKCFLAIFVVALAGVSTAVAAPVPSTVPLLRIHAALTEIDSGRFFEDLDYFVFDDGVVTGFLAFSRDSTCSGCPWGGGIGQGSGTAEQFQALRLALGTNTVGFQKGDCEVDASRVGLGTFEVTWYGRNTRRNNFLVHVDTGGTHCAPQVANVLTAIETYVFQSGAPTSNLAPFR